MQYLTAFLFYFSSNRDSYPYDHQFQIITKYITDKTQTPSLNMKLSLLQYTRGLIALMDANDFTNSAVTRLAITRVITWISEPKSADIRKESANVIVALFQLNPSEFSMVLSSLPNSIQVHSIRVIASTQRCFNVHLTLYGRYGR